jgi:serine/threonine-protein kinase
MEVVAESTPAPSTPAPSTPAPSTSAGLDTPPAAAAEPAEVEITVDATPRIVDVYLGAAKVGTSAAPIRIKRAEGRVRLTFKATGYLPKDVDVQATASTVVNVVLKKAAGQGRKEYEF